MLTFGYRVGSCGTDGETTKEGKLGNRYMVEEEGWSPGGYGDELVHVPQLAERGLVGRKSSVD